MQKDTTDRFNNKQTLDINTEISEIEINEFKLVKTDLCRNIKLYFREFCLNSSLHGIRYLGEKGRSKIERVWWFLFFIASIFMCSQLIKKSWEKWDSMPVVIGFTEKPTLVWQVPFPAVTFCPEVKVRQRVYNFTEALYKHTSEYKMTEEEFRAKSFSDASLVCNNDNFSYMSGEDFINQSTIDFIVKVAPELKQLLMACAWDICNPVFSKSLTEEGLCYTFNMLDREEIFNEGVINAFHPSINKTSDWSLNKGYRKGINWDEEQNVHPKRKFNPGKKSPFLVVLEGYKQDFDRNCGGSFEGVKIILHSPEELPRVDQHYTIKVSWNQAVDIIVQPDIMTASKELEAYEPSRRNCFFSQEKKLRYFKTYTKSNCEIECLTNNTLNKCGCVAFYMPHSKNTTICGPRKHECVFQAKKMFEQNRPINYSLFLKKILPRFIWTNKWVKNFVTPFVIPASGSEFSTENEDTNITSPKCNCLPGCTSLAYNADTISVHFNYVPYLVSLREYADYPGAMISYAQIYFKDSQFMTWRRSELYNQTDFLASCGGLLGIFMGFSFLSLIEIVYFITLRFCSNITRREIHI